MIGDNPVFYDPDADMLRVELRPWPAGGNAMDAGGEDGEDGLVIHYAPDGKPWAWEVEHASKRPDLVARAFAALRSSRGIAEAA